MKKRVVLTLLSVVAVVCSCSRVRAATVQPRASAYLSRYIATLSEGNAPGQLNIAFSVTASRVMTKVGVSRIDIYRSNGTYVTSINGSTANGLLALSTMHHSGTYTYNGISGVSYYAIVTVYAGDTTGSDTRTVTTNTVKAP